MKIVVVAYKYSEEYGVAAFRPRSLVKALKNKDYKVECITKESLGRIAQKFFLFWSFKCFLKLILMKYEVAYCTFGPFRHIPFLLLAFSLKKCHLIIDMRDPWAINIATGYKGMDEKWDWKACLADKLEYWLYKRSGKFIVVTPGMKEYYKRKWEKSEKIEVVLNGYSFHVKRKHERNNTKIRYVCIGRFASYSIEKARIILQKIKDKYKIDDFELIFVGTDNETIKLLNELNLKEVTKIIDKCGYKEAIKVAETADYGMLILRNESLEFGTKIFDYIGIGLKIIGEFDKNSSFYSEFSSFINGNQEGSIDIKKYDRNYQIGKIVKIIEMFRFYI